jgi:hypothetical protein
MIKLKEFNRSEMDYFSDTIKIIKKRIVLMK